MKQSGEDSFLIRSYIVVMDINSREQLACVQLLESTKTQDLLHLQSD